MKTIGLLGGMSWESTVTYYQTINRIVNQRLGGLHSAKILLHSVDFHEVNRVDGLLERAAQSLEAGGADFLVLCTNTMHRLAPEIEASVSIPLLHIVDATAKRIRDEGLTFVGLLGTKTTMEKEFYPKRLAKHGIRIVIPAKKDRELVHRVIFEELCRGKIVDDSGFEYVRIISNLDKAGAEGVILGCTELGLLVGSSDTPVPLFDTAKIHAEAAAHYALES